MINSSCPTHLCVWKDDSDVHDDVSQDVQRRYRYLEGMTCRRHQHLLPRRKRRVEGTGEGQIVHSQILRSTQVQPSKQTALLNMHSMNIETKRLRETQDTTTINTPTTKTIAHSTQHTTHDTENIRQRAITKHKHIARTSSTALSTFPPCPIPTASPPCPKLSRMENPCSLVFVAL